MRQRATLIAATLAATARAAKDARTFAVLRFSGSEPLMEARVDPIVAPGRAALHAHTIQGGSAFGVSSTGEDMLNSTCSTALVEGDDSAYWVPKLYFHDRDAGTLEGVEMYYFNVYYFFEPTDDDIVAFPVGLQIVAGDTDLRECPDFGGSMQLDGGDEAGVQPAQWICPRQSYEPASRPSADESDGSTAPIQDPDNVQGGQGFPFSNCDGDASPLRMDVHFPSCYDPSKGLTDHENNMAYPTFDWLTGKQNCPDGWLHVPHMFYEMYWDTPAFADRWTPDEGYQPFVLSNGDTSGCGAHGDFLAGWDETILQHIIDTCNVAHAGMHTCAGVTARDADQECTAPSPFDEDVSGTLAVLAGDNPLVGFGTTTEVAGGATSQETTYGIDIDVSLTISVAAATTTSTGAPDVYSVTTTFLSSTTPQAEATPAVTTDVVTTTLANGKVITTTIVEWVTVTTIVYDTEYKTVYEKREPEYHHAHAHVHRHQPPHGARK